MQTIAFIDDIPMNDIPFVKNSPFLYQRKGARGMDLIIVTYGRL